MECRCSETSSVSVPSELRQPCEALLRGQVLVMRWWVMLAVSVRQALRALP